MTTLGLMPVSRMGTDELTFRLRDALRRRRLDGWRLKFGMSIARAAKRPGWVPSVRQVAAMRRIVADLRCGAPDLPGEDSLVDDGDSDNG